MRTHCVAFCGALHEHHINEDGVFPVLAQQFPEPAPVLDRLAREHTEVARVIYEETTLTGSDIMDTSALPPRRPGR